MQEDLKAFINQVFSINATVSTIYGSALTVGSRDMSGGGINNSASETVFRLRKETASLAELLGRTDKDESTIRTKAQNVEGYLMTLQTLGQISAEFCNTLINDLHTIVGK
jgi:hypothetical protein